MSYALFEVLNGGFQDGTPVTEHGTDALVRSVQDHLYRLFNARHGTLRHLPDHGLPDVPALYGGLPYSADDLAQAVRQTIERYEPRLQRVRVKIVRVPGQECVLGIEIGGRLPGGGWARFESQFHTGGSAEVKPAASRGGDHARLF